MMEIDVKVVGKNIRELRRECGLTQEKLAELADTSESHIGKIERGEIHDPSFRVIGNIANVFEVSLDQLAYGTLTNSKNYFVQELIAYSDGFSSKKKIMVLEMVKRLTEIIKEYDPE